MEPFDRFGIAALVICLLVALAIAALPPKKAKAEPFYCWGKKGTAYLCRDGDTILGVSR